MIRVEGLYVQEGIIIFSKNHRGASHVGVSRLFKIRKMFSFRSFLFFLSTVCRNIGNIHLTGIREFEGHDIVAFPPPLLTFSTAEF